MTGVSLSIRPVGLKDVEARIARLADATERARPLMKAIGAVLESSTRRRFRAGVGPDGRPWKPSIRVRTRGGKTLVDHGHLRDSITHDADDHMAVVGSNLVYAAIHQLGGVIKPKTASALRFNIPGVGWRSVRQVTIPARPYLGVSEDDRSEIVNQVELYVRKALS